ncbi:hypothetical protein [Chitinilyticum piscinae]|uniref:Uncharacterized protein n=1 Tax=Chitinilyticum piscinae TaxID=2866724 RepID=A0A8J7FNG8_9NEIS|nr:hypothetical protein [Chitinilyticum piscinae]MBE9609976.1 hypothetical protein [Chitinilyticum piscinae]
MQMQQHGQFDLYWQGDVLVVRYFGQWNRQASEALHASVRGQWQQRGGRPWGMLSDLREWGGATPDALDAWWAFFADAARHDLLAVTDILPSLVHELMVRTIAEKAGSLARYRNSHTIDEALAWLHAQGLSTT